MLGEKLAELVSFIGEDKAKALSVHSAIESDFHVCHLKRKCLGFYMQWSFRAISYRFVHRRTSRFGSRFGSKRDFKNMVELFDCKMQEKAPKSNDFGAFYGGQYRTRNCDTMHVNHVLIPAELTVHQRDYYSESRGICQALFSRYHAISRSAASP